MSAHAHQNRKNVTTLLIDLRYNEGLRHYPLRKSVQKAIHQIIPRAPFDKTNMDM